MFLHLSPYFTPSRCPLPCLSFRFLPPLPYPQRPQGVVLTDGYRAAASEQRQSILNQILEPEAQERLGRIRLVKQSRAEDVENRLIMLAKSGQLREKVRSRSY